MMIRILKIGFLGMFFVLAGDKASSQEQLKWGATFKETYQDIVTGKSISFSVKTPPKPEDSANKLPLIVALNGGPKVLPSVEFPFIEVRPSGGGIWGYRSLSAVDVMSVIRTMKQKYPIDPDRISLIGSSAGASGAMHLVSLYPDEFSAMVAMVAAGNDYPIRNFSNLPLAIHHGDVDWTSAICDARVQFQKMQSAGNRLAFLKEYPGSGHSVPAKEHKSIVKWMLEQKRDPAPRSIAIDCETPTLGRHAYIQILEFDDPHQRAILTTKRDADRMKIEPQNVFALTVDLKKLPKLERIEIGKQNFELKAKAGLAELRREGDEWELSPNFSPKISEIRPYEAGAAANLYQGEPLLIVYGTVDSKRGPQLRVAAEDLEKCGGPLFASMRQTAILIVADTELTSEQEASHNLILLGRPDENLISARILEKLPIEIESGKLIVGSRESLVLNDQVLSMLHFHPEHPNRLVYLIAPFTEKGFRLPQRFLAGSNGFHRIGQPDLIVQNSDNVIAREMQFDKNWEWIFQEGDAPKISAGFEDRNELVRAHLRVMLKKSDADFALWWGPADKGMWGMDFNFLKKYQPDFYTLIDFKTQKRVLETMTGGVSGADLKIISDRWISKNEITILPELDLNAIDPEKFYRIHIPMDMYIKLGQRKKNLIDPKPGPEISPGDLVPEIFK